MRDGQHAGADHADLVCEHDGLDPVRQAELCVWDVRVAWLAGGSVAACA